MGQYPHTVKPADAARYAEAREQLKVKLAADFRRAVYLFVLTAAQNGIHTFEHGPVFAELHHELNEAEARLLPYGLAASRKGRKKITPGKRRRVYVRDEFTCKGCGWRANPDETDRARNRSRERRFLTVDHILPESEGGSSELGNLQTLCSVCNGEKGRVVDLDAIRAAVARLEQERAA